MEALATQYISEHTKELLSRRESDDFRVGFIYDTLFSEDFGGTHPGRKFTMVSNDKKGQEDFVIEKGQVGEMFTYECVTPGDPFRLKVDGTIQQLSMLKKHKQSMAVDNIGGRVELGDVWVLLWTESAKENEEGSVNFNVYCNPSSEDCQEIVRTEQLIMACFIQYNNFFYKDANGKEQTNTTKTWTFQSVFPEESYPEYAKISKEKEEQNLKDMFGISFSTRTTPSFQQPPAFGG